jgi:4-diphosphocytidyl-2-C-methyl-D-erythritol kinase
VNLSLEVLGKRPDGYHELRTVMQAVSLFDELQFEPRPDGEIRLTCSGLAAPEGEDNLVVRAARLLQQDAGVTLGASVALRKRIPLGGGLGGGSSDAAVTLLALRSAWRLDVPGKRLAEMAAELGSDVAFFLQGGTALCEGRGERVRQVACARRIHYVLVTPPHRVSTAQAYGALRAGLTTHAHDSNNVLRALERGDAGLLGRSLRNDLQAPVLSLHPDLDRIWHKLMRTKALQEAEGALLSGSGASFFVVARTEKGAEQTAEALRSELAVVCEPAHSIPPWTEAVSLLAIGRTHV